MGFRFHVQNASRLRLSAGEIVVLLEGVVDGAAIVEPGSVATTADGLEVHIRSIALVNRPRVAGDGAVTLRIDEPAFPVTSLVGKTLVG